jgi:putative sigma-54 modulation protein
VWPVSLVGRILRRSANEWRSVQVVISVVERRGNVSDDAKDYARDKANRLLRFYDRIQQIEVIFTNEALHNEVEFIVTADHKLTFVGTEKHEDVFAAVDLVMDKLKSQITRHKEKFRNRKHPE